MLVRIAWTLHTCENVFDHHPLCTAETTTMPNDHVSSIVFNPGSQEIHACMHACILVPAV